MQQLNKTSNTRERRGPSPEPFLGERHRIISKGEASTLVISSFFQASQIASVSPVPCQEPVSVAAVNSYFCSLCLTRGGSPWGAPEQREPRSVPWLQTPRPASTAASLLNISPFPYFLPLFLFFVKVLLLKGNFNYWGI